uniref:AlNc14C65G4611 protein n=1 Tax=Albugo laibachii Nc14 TaxID=890382 RepID=F0WD91_9STRA|nr:AlNc14C65G4611 [Albugo laibachii Nc14]|eukprot:CCA19163.1 AlNc14C65G4611 [Albugo laibachii Nc14]
MDLTRAPPPPPRSPPPKLDKTTTIKQEHIHKDTIVKVAAEAGAKQVSIAPDTRKARATFGVVLELFHDETKSNEQVLDRLQDLFEEAVEEAEHEMRNQPPPPPLPPPPLPAHTLDDNKVTFDPNERSAISCTRSKPRSMVNSNNSAESTKRNRQGNASSGDTIANKILRTHHSARPPYRQQKSSKLLQKLASRT